jgi:hypothetical protein
MSIKQNGGVFGRNPTFNDVTIEGDLIINGEVFTGLDFQGSWNASTNSPALASSVGTNGEFYIVSVAGGTNLNGITNWGIGDWAIFNGTAWQRVEGGADGNFNDVTVAGTLGVTGEITANGGIALGDNAKAIFGAGSDLQIYHDGSNSRIYEGGTGNLKIQANNIEISDVGGYKSFSGTSGAEATLYYNNAPKIATTATGIDVVGMATMDGLTVDGEIILDSATGNHLLKFYRSDSTINAGNALGQILFGGSDEGDFPDAASIQASAATSWGATSSATQLDFFTTRNTTVTPVKRLTVADSGDISFYEDTGTTAKLFWDASAESLGIGTSSPTSPLTVNRLSTDGTIASFEKDGATVGSIGATSGRLFVGNGDVGLRFAGDLDFIAPWDATTNAARDNAISLGNSGNRFKDLYLSGGVYLGGTVAANLLEDYEEGTWTPEVADASTGGNQASGGTFSGRYTKIGNRVFCQISLVNIATVGMTATNGIFIRALPFTAYSGSNMYSPATILKSAITSTEGTLVGLVNINSTTMSINNDVSGVVGATSALVSQISSGGGDIYTSFFYETTA